MLTLGEAKDHLRVDFDDEDVSIRAMIESAFDHMRSIDVQYLGEADELPPALRHAALMLVAHFYTNREAVGEPMQAVPLGFDRLIAPYRSLQV